MMMESHARSALPETAGGFVEVSDFSSLSDQPTVSVLMLAYNHEKFISQAIDGVLSQRVEFPMEIVIADDCSRDGTLRVALDYQLKFPRLVRVVSSCSNVGVSANLARALSLLRGRYVAYCEGDDYWIDPTKLGRQIEILEADPSLVIAFSDAIEVDTDGVQVGQSNITRISGSIPASERFSGSTMFERVHIPTLTAVFRNNPLLVGDNFLGLTNCDSYLFAMLGQYGDAVRIDGTTAAYRLHPAGVWNSLGTSARTWSAARTARAICADIDGGRVLLAVSSLRRVAAAAIAHALFHLDGLEGKAALLAYRDSITYPFRSGVGARSLLSALYSLIFPAVHSFRVLQRRIQERRLPARDLERATPASPSSHHVD